MMQHWTKLQAISCAFKVGRVLVGADFALVRSMGLWVDSGLHVAQILSIVRAIHLHCEQPSLTGPLIQPHTAAHLPALASHDLVNLLTLVCSSFIFIRICILSALYLLLFLRYTFLSCFFISNCLFRLNAQYSWLWVCFHLDDNLDIPSS